MVAPSGEQIEISSDDQRVVVVEVGGGLRSYVAAGRELLDGYGAGELCTSAHGQVLIPWPNRIDGGCYEFDGRSHQLPIDKPDEQTAVHGLVRWAAWEVGERRANSVVMQRLLHPRPGYPFALALSIEYVLAGSGLTVTTTATNVGDEACPYACGVHPYLTLGTGRVDSLVLTVPARTFLTSDERGLPIGTLSVENTEFDFRRPRPIGPTRLDNCFTDLERDDDGLARVELHDPDGDAALALWFDDRYGYLMLYTGDTRPDVARRSLAVEPMTAPPNAFRSGEGLIRLEPGASYSSSWGIDPYASPP
jgi:aldose 1-epimerase